ncbi:unnamed protein product [Caenorhabditis angaria]|uniref:Uncharacterized protein n=1 Tax=Caenorhabditis angaria TaxID=860376 RepID=A0A9P1IU41_9PELO|nr:unnamed protein product [Caenorhabditis angaria]
MTHNFRSSLSFYTISKPFNCPSFISRAILYEFSDEYLRCVCTKLFCHFHNYRKEMKWVYGMDIETVVYYAAIIYDGKKIRIRSLMFLSSLAFIVSTHYAVIVYCGTMLKLHMDGKMILFSSQYKRLNHQLFRALVIQIVVPTVLMFLPVLAIYALPFFDFDISINTSPVLAGLSVYPATDGLVVICCIDIFRNFVIMIFTSSYFITIHLIAIQFVFRYWLVFDKKKIKYFKGITGLITWGGTSCTMFLVWITVINFCGMPNEFIDDFLDDEMMKVYGLEIRNIEHFALLVHSSNFETNLKGTLCVVGVLILILPNYIVIFYYGYHLWHSMDENVIFISTQTKNIQIQFIRALYFQITIPSVVLFIPVLVVHTLPFFNLNISISTIIFINALGFYPAIDGLVVLILIKEFRMGVKRK